MSTGRYPGSGRVVEEAQLCILNNPIPLANPNSRQVSWLNPRPETGTLHCLSCIIKRLVGAFGQIAGFLQGVITHTLTAPEAGVHVEKIILFAQTVPMVPTAGSGYTVGGWDIPRVPE